MGTRSSAGPGWALLIGALVASCGGARPIDLARYGAAITSTDVARGRDRHDVVCVPCHGDHYGHRGPLFANLHRTPAQIRRQVREGDAFMPAIPVRRLSDADLEAVLAYFLTTGTCAQPSQAVPPPPAAGSQPPSIYDTPPPPAAYEAAPVATDAPLETSSE